MSSNTFLGDSDWDHYISSHPLVPKHDAVNLGIAIDLYAQQALAHKRNELQYHITRVEGSIASTKLRAMKHMDNGCEWLAERDLVALDQYNDMLVSLKEELEALS